MYVNNWLGGMGKRTRNLMTVGVASVLWGIWKTQNQACFQNQLPNEPCEVIYCICYWINFWSSLQVKEDAKLELQCCAKLLAQIAGEVFSAKGRWKPWIRRLT